MKEPPRAADPLRDAAIAAVAAAIKKLPPQSEVAFTPMEDASGWGQRGNDPAPANPGSKVRGAKPYLTNYEGPYHPQPREA